MHSTQEEKEAEEGREKDDNNADGYDDDNEEHLLLPPQVVPHILIAIRQRDRQREKNSVKALFYPSHASPCKSTKAEIFRAGKIGDQSSDFLVLE